MLLLRRGFSSIPSTPAHRASMAPLIELCARRGFVFPGSSIYGGYASTFDFGPLGSQLKKNILDAWWRDFIELRPECVGLDTSIIVNPSVWHASGHVKEFTDPLVHCNVCNHRTRADKLLEDVYEVSPDAVAACIKNGGMKSLSDELSRVEAACPMCKSNDLGEPVNFNLLFETSVGTATSHHSTSSDNSSDTVNSNNNNNKAYLRPETAQGAYINFANVISSTRKRLPVGVGQIGKAFRNEIAPGKSFLFRTREFELMELQWFIQDNPEEAEKWYLYWVDTCLQWLTDHGVDRKMVRAREHHVDEVAHYANATTDIEFNFPGLGWGELWGIADRGTYDIEQHIHATSTGGEITKDVDDSELSRKKLKKKQKKIEKKKKTNPLLYLDPETGERSIPRVIEPALGLTRIFLAVLSSAMQVESVPPSEEGGESTTRTVLRLHPRLAPVKVAVMPLLKNRSELVSLAETVHLQLASRFSCELDTAGSIGRRYRRQDEIGTPLCITIDHDSLKDNTATLRDRDTLKQVRLPLKEIEGSSLDDLLSHFKSI
jgi:glycyl-tRNA synthetase